MFKPVLALAVSLAVLSPAYAFRDIGEPELGLELSLSDVTLPDSTAGLVGFKQCETCAFESHSVTDSTRYLLNGRPLLFRDFVKAAADLRAAKDGGANTLVGVYIDVATKRVNRIALFWGAH
jgi:hypothetical protein